MNAKEVVMQMYEEQLANMILNGKKWRAQHPTARPEINFVRPKDAVIVAPITLGIKSGYVKCNAEGLELLEALHAHSEMEPTILMCEAVLEQVFK